ncbi:hypothetical protein FRC04_004992 [Tulasnella sp. 424]|nr:hypothetical protein FRC04_004992 [Tulasnella sp. 424]KAG8962532.1 hypothetical protein FRC05_005295 [Tulasnella sp. 425]
MPQFAGAGFYKVDVSDQPEVSDPLGVSNIPTFIAFKNGQKLGHMAGATPPVLQQFVQTHAA